MTHIRFFKNASFLLVLLTVVSCGHFTNRTELKQVRALKQVLDSVETMLELDTARYKKKWVQAQEKMDRFEQVKPDSMSWEVVEVFAAGSQLTRAFSKAVDNYPYMQSELVLRRRQLKDLKHDLVYDKIDTLRIKKALDQEARNIYLLKLYVQGMVANLHHQDQQYQQIMDRLSSITDSLWQMRNPG